MRLIDADSVKDFFFSETSGTEEIIRDLAEKHNLTYLNNVNENEADEHKRKVDELAEKMNEGISPYAWYIKGRFNGEIGRFHYNVDNIVYLDKKPT